MTVYVSTACLGAPDLRRALADLAAAGVEAVELGAARGVPADDAAIAAEVRRARLACVLHNYFPPPERPFVLNLASPDPETVELSLAHVRRALALAASLDAPFYSVHAGFASDPVGFDGTSFVFPASAADREAALARFAERLAAAAAHARELGVRLLVENNVCTEAMRGHVLLADAGEATRVLAACPEAGLLVDTGHLNVAARTLGFDRATYLDAVAPHVGAFHVHENDGRADSHDRVTDGGWVVGTLREARFAGLPLVLEARAADAADAAGQARRLAAALRE